MRRLLIVLLAAATLGACAKNTSSRATASGGTEPLRAEEIRRTGASDLYSAIRMARPTFLQTRGRTSILRSEEAEPAVYLDDRPLGGLSMLRDIQANTVIEVRYFGAAQAQMRWGAGHSAGAILVITGTPR
jgi:hypothetical protein